MGVLIVCIVFIPGATVPRNTPASLIWKRKLWELHVGWLGLAVSLVTAWFFTQGTKNMFGKPRPDLLDRCQPDFENAAKYAVGGFLGEASTGRLYSAAICQQTDSDKLDDGFRSYPSGHSSSAAAGLVYLSLFLASKFAVNIPFVASGDSMSASLTRTAFPSRSQTAQSSFPSGGDPEAQWNDRSPTPSGRNGKVVYDNAKHNQRNQSLRLQAAAPPIYLLIIVLAPFATSVWIAGSRWYDFRHHGFDILFGYLMGVITAFFAFRLYHMPIREGAGWAWGPRSDARAFWAGVGRLGYAGERRDLSEQSKRHDGPSSAGPAEDFRRAHSASLTHDGRRQPMNGMLASAPQAYTGAGEDYSVARPYGDDGGYHQVDVSDRGHGMQRDVEMQPIQNRI